MKRATLIALVLAAPELAAAQTAGTIAFDNGRPRFPNYVNATECAGGQTINLSWTASAAGAASYTVYAANTQHPGATNTSAPCYTATQTVNGTAVVAGKVIPKSGNDPIAATGQTMSAQSFDPAALVSAAGRACSGGDQPVYVCVLGAGSPPPFAVGQLTLNTLKPLALAQPTVTAGNQALTVSWIDAGGSPAAVDWNATAEPTGLASGAAAASGSTGYVTSLSNNRIDGLVNGVTYNVSVVARSAAGNLSDPSPDASGVPTVTSGFWQEYRTAGGKETGGCAGGPAGVASLGALAAILGLLALRRRS